jgi:hypothetical protein
MENNKNERNKILVHIRKFMENLFSSKSYETCFIFYKKNVASHGA